MSVGNIVLASLAQSEGGLGHAGSLLAKLLGVKERVFPVSNEDIQLCATLEDGSRVTGEFEIRRVNKPRILDLQIEGALKGVWEPTRQTILNTDFIIAGPGSLWTSIGAILAVPGVRESLAASSARVIFVCNTTTQPGQTDGMTVRDHVEVVSRLLGRTPDHVLLNSELPPAAEEATLASEGLCLLKTVGPRSTGTLRYGYPSDYISLVAAHFPALGICGRRSELLITMSTKRPRPSPKSSNRISHIESLRRNGKTPCLASTIKSDRRRWRPNAKIVSSTF